MTGPKSILQKRVYAFTTDLAIIVVANYFLMAAFNRFVQTVFFHLSTNAQMLLISKMTLMTSVSLTMLTFAYFSLFYFVTNGRTMGKTIFGLKVKSSNEEVSLKESILRALSYLVCAFTGSFLFALSYIRKDEKSLADVFSGTNVVLDTPEEKMGVLLGTEFEIALKKKQEIAEEEVEYFEQNKSA